MCGIVGYTGPREAGPILIEGLKRLEYRGYDSAGIALVDEEGDLFVEKKAGKLSNLQTAIADRTPHAALGLAHTRWATHGRPKHLNPPPLESWWGWGLWSFGRPWVAQRVCARPSAACGVRSAMAVCRFDSLPAFFSTNRSPSSSTRAMPAE